MVETWININKIIKYKDLIAHSMEWIDTLIAAMPEKIKRETYHKRERILVNSNFVKEFEHRFWGGIEDKSDEVHMKYGIPGQIIEEACKNLYKSHPEIVNYCPTKRTFAIINPEAFIKMAGLTPQKPFTDKNWITVEQIKDYIYGPENWIYSDYLEKTIDMLREFTKTHPDAVYITQERCYDEFAKRFDPTRLKRKYWTEFKIHFGLQTVSRSKLKQATYITDDAELDAILKDFTDIGIRGSATYDKKTGAPALRQSFLDQFCAYVKHLQENKLMEAQRKNALSAKQINNLVKNQNKYSLYGTEQKMKDFAKHKPDAVIIQRNFIGLQPGYLNEFLDFAGMQPRQAPRVLPIQQPEIDPALPGYPSDSDLKPIDDKKMDAIAWRLAGKKVKTATKADDMIFAEWAKQSRKSKS